MHQKIMFYLYLITEREVQPTLVAQLDARPTGDQDVTGLILAGSGNILSWRLIMKYFLQSISSSAYSRRAVVSFW